MIPITLQVLTNLSCNLNCSYCYEHKENVVNNIDTIKTYLYIKFKFLKPEEDHVIVDLIGGESLLYPELCDEIISYAFTLAKQFNKCVWISTSSNGTTLKNPKVRDLIVKYRNRFSIGISIDGTKENHDRHRVYYNGKGSYDDAIEYLPWLFETLGKDKVGVKSTFTLDTFKKYYAEGMINLHKLGFNELIGNIVYEDIIPKEETYNVFNELKKVLDYILDNRLENTVSIMQIGNKETVRNYVPKAYFEHENWCGTCTYMSCLGLDGKLYGCNRFCTMDRPGMELGTFDSETINITNTELLNTVKGFKRLWKDECATCFLRSECPTCVAAIYEVEDKNKYIAEKRQCGWTHAVTMARFYYRSKLIERDLNV